MKVSIIGRGGHAARHIDLVKASPGITLHAVYHPRAQTPAHSVETDDFARVLDSDAVIISSPTATHAAYLDRLSTYSGYVLVEKPAVSTREETVLLRAWPDERKRRVRVNYNFEYSCVADAIRQALARPEFQSPILLNIYATLGLAFTSEYASSWRRDLTQSFGVLELVGVHFTHFASGIFGRIVASTTRQWWMARHDNAPPDTVLCSLLMANGAMVNLFLSYAAPRLNRFTLVATDGYWEYDGSHATLRSPRDAFNSAGMFVPPPAQHTAEIPYDRMWADSFSGSVNAFFDVVRSRGHFDSYAFDSALDAMEPVFAARDAAVTPWRSE